MDTPDAKIEVTPKEKTMQPPLGVKAERTHNKQTATLPIRRTRALIQLRVGAAPQPPPLLHRRDSSCARRETTGATASCSRRRRCRRQRSETPWPFSSWLTMAATASFLSLSLSLSLSIAPESSSLLQTPIDDLQFFFFCC